MNLVGTKNEQTRNEWVEQALKALPPGWRILDAGAGEQRYRAFCGHLKYVCQDIAQYDGSGDSRGLQTGTWDFGKLDLICDITSIPEPDASFDAILCTEVLEHVADPVAAVTELARLLRPGGQLLLTAPFCSLTHFAPYHFSTGFNRYFYSTHLPNLGIEVVELTPNGNYFEYIAQELRRVPEIVQKFTPGHRSRWPGVLRRLMLRLLERYSLADTGSSELLAFGYHVRGVKL